MYHTVLSILENKKKLRPCIDLWEASTRYASWGKSMQVMQGKFELNTHIFWLMQVKYWQVLKYSNNTNNASNYLHNLHVLCK